MISFRGKQYHGVRYPQGGSIRPPLCVVIVIPDVGEPYSLLPRLDLKNYLKKNVKGAEVLPFRYEWGIAQESIWTNSAYDGSQWTKVQTNNIDEHTARSKQLALAIAADFFGTGKGVKIALTNHLWFYDTFVKTFPENEWVLNDAYVVLRGIARIP